MKKISFIIPAYNAANVIGDCIKNILEIDYADYEIIVINDGSSDNTLDVLNAFHDKRIKILSQENKGVSISRNVGLSVAKGDYIAFIDADDKIKSYEYSKFLNSIEFENMDFIMFGYEIINGDKSEKVKLPLKAGKYDSYMANRLGNFLFDLPFSENYTSNYMGGKIYQYLLNYDFLVKNNICFNPKIHFGEDCLFCLSFFKKARNFKVYEEYLYGYLVYETSASHRYRDNFWNELMNLYNFAIEIQGKDFDYKNEIFFFYGREVISRILTLKKPKSKMKQIDLIKSMINNKQFQTAIHNMEFTNWTIKEKMMLFLLKHKASFLIVILYDINYKIKGLKFNN